MVQATLNRTCKVTVPALETQNLSPSHWGEEEIAVLRFLASSSLREKNPTVNKPQTNEPDGAGRLLGGRLRVCGSKGHELAQAQKAR